MIYDAPDFDLQNRQVFANLDFFQKMRVFNAFQKSGISQPLAVPVRDIILEAPAFRHPLGPKAVVALNRLNYRAVSKAFFSQKPPEDLLNLASFPAPREPGSYRPPVAKRDPKEVAHAKALAKEIAHVHALEDALATAKTRLEKMK